jgi:hypothetical protein
VELHIFYRIQGNVQAARVEVERARHELEQVNLNLRDGASNQYREYQNAKAVSDRYGAEIPHVAMENRKTNAVILEGFLLSGAWTPVRDGLSVSEKRANRDL